MRRDALRELLFVELIECGNVLSIALQLHVRSVHGGQAQELGIEILRRRRVCCAELDPTEGAGCVFTTLAH